MRILFFWNQSKIVKNLVFRVELRKLSLFFLEFTSARPVSVYYFINSSCRIIENGCYEHQIIEIPRIADNIIRKNNTFNSKNTN